MRLTDTVPSKANNYMGATQCGARPLWCLDDEGAGPDEPVLLLCEPELPTLPLPKRRSGRDLTVRARSPTPQHVSPKGRTPKTPRTPARSERAGTEYLDLDSLSNSDPESDEEIRYHGEGCVYVEGVYDCYDYSERKYEVLPITTEVLHWRNSGRTLGVNRVCPSILSRDSSSDAESACSTNECAGQSSAALKRARAKARIEVHTRWGVLAGKILSRGVLALHTLGSVALLRIQWTRKHNGPSVWRRVNSRAKGVLQKAHALAMQISGEQQDSFDDQWEAGRGNDLLVELFTTEYLDTIMILAKASQKLFASQPVLAEASVPCRVFGDIHGQIRDLLLLLHTWGFPGERCSHSPNGPSFVFNGDFVDRGEHGLEVIGLLLALKVAMPEKVWLVRGNHEDMGRKTYDMIQEAFDQLPIACLIDSSVLCVHGGIGDGKWDLNELRAVQRPIKDKDLGSIGLRWILNILWSDPIEDDANRSSDEEGDSIVFGVHESPRINSVMLFGWDVTKTFCARNNISMIVRSHQCKRSGLGFDVMHDNMLIRVFSARDYEGGSNDGAVLLFREAFREPSDGRKQLVVRPQVLRSVTKSRPRVSQSEAKARATVSKKSEVKDVTLGSKPEIVRPPSVMQSAAAAMRKWDEGSFGKEKRKSSKDSTSSGSNIAGRAKLTLNTVTQCASVQLGQQASPKIDATPDVRSAPVASIAKPEIVADGVHSAPLSAFNKR